MTSMMDDRWSVPVRGEPVQHCNSRTGYEMIRHPYTPGANCGECDRIADTVAEANRREPVEVKGGELGWASGACAATPAPSSPPAPPALDGGRSLILSGCGRWWQTGDHPRHATCCGDAGGCPVLVLGLWDELGDRSDGDGAGVTTRGENHPNG